MSGRESLGDPITLSVPRSHEALADWLIARLIDDGRKEEEAIEYAHSAIRMVADTQSARRHFVDGYAETLEARAELAAELGGGLVGPVDQLVAEDEA